MSHSEDQHMDSGDEGQPGDHVEEMNVDSAIADDQATPTSVIPQNTGDPSSHSAQDFRGTMSTVHTQASGHLNYPQTGGNESTEGTFVPAIIHQPSGVSSIYQSLQQFNRASSHDDPSSQSHHSDPPQKQHISSVSVHNQTTEKPSESEIQDPELSTPKAALIMQIECKLEKQPARWQKVLQKTLQSLFNKDLQFAANICNIDISPSNPFLAKVVLDSVEACEMLLESKKVSLKLKDINEEATLHFKTTVPLDDTPPTATTHTKYGSSGQKSQEIPMMVNAVVDVQKYGNQLATQLLEKFSQHQTGPHTLTVTGTFKEVEEFHKQLCQVVGQPLTSNPNSSASEHTNPDQMKTNQETMRVPLFQYWYLNHMHREDLDSIQNKHGVTIEADVCVSVKETSESNSNSFANATLEFQELVVKSTLNIDSVPVPSDLIKDIQSLDNNLMFNGSAQNWNLSGPRDRVAAVQRMWKVDPKVDAESSEKGPKDNAQNKNHFGESRWNSPKSIEMNIQDTALANGLCISPIHWKLLQKAFKKQYKDLKNKFDVDFKEKDRPTHNDVMVTAHSVGNHTAYLEVNALRALMALYQKVVMTTMSCSLQNVSHTQTDAVKMCLNDIRDKNPSLVVEDQSSSGGVWMITGLADHLRFAISQIERKVGGPVFDETHKHIIGYEQNTEFLRPFTDGPAWNQSRGLERAEWEGAASGGPVGLHKDMRQQGKAEREWENVTREKGASGSSVDREANSNMEEEDGHKLGGEGSKGTNGFEKKAGSVGGIRDDSKALRGGADGGGSKEDDNCPICMDEFTNQKKLSCGHGFCEDCLRRSVESLGASCPVCKEVFGKIEGDQPNGTMNDYIQRTRLPGFKCDTIVINYNIPNGIQSDKHPKPGRPFHGAQRTAYLPDNKEGKEVLALLRRAFNQKLIFTVGTSRTSGMDDCVTWNDIHHKTNPHGGPQNFGYPDDGYLKRVREELKAKGIE